MREIYGKIKFKTSVQKVSSNLTYFCIAFGITLGAKNSKKCMLILKITLLFFFKLTSNATTFKIALKYYLHELVATMDAFVNRGHAPPPYLPHF